MKELSIEQKAQRYDEALERAKKWYNANTNAGYRGIFEEIFPELKESEDERIRKTLIHIVKGACSKYGIKYQGKEIDEEKLLSWLEKQGKNNMGISEATKQKLEDNLNKALEKETPESWNKFLDEQNLVNKVEPKFKVGDWVIFNENHNSAYQVEKIDNYRYYLRHYLGGTLSVHFDNELIREWNINDAKDGDVLADEYGIYIFNSFDSLDDKLFICKCAYQYSKKVFEFGGMLCKKTDVYPATKEQRDTLERAITNAGYKWDAENRQLRKIEQKTPIEGEFPYNNPSATLDGEIENIWWKLSSGGKFSATKEGFREVITHFANYIEQKTSDLPKGEDYGIDGLYAAIDILQKTLGEVEGYQSDDGILEHKCAISAVKELSKKKPVDKVESRQEELTEFEKAVKQVMEEVIECGDTHNLKADAEMLLRLVQKSTWSEEYIELLDNTIKFIEDRVAATSPSLRTYIPTLTGKEIPFLKALKDRVQPKQEWNEEDERTYKSVLYAFEHNYSLNSEQQKFVKSLKERYVWKPSDEQMKNLSRAFNGGTYRASLLMELYLDLKKLREE